MPTSRFLVPVLAITVVVLCFVGCRSSSGNEAPLPIQDGGDLEGRVDLAEDPGALATFDLAMVDQFGGLSSPHFATPGAACPDGFDPNRWTLDAADDSFFAQVEAGNRVWFANRIAALEAGEFDSLEPTAYAEDLWEDWLAWRAEMPADPDAPLDPAHPEEGSWRDGALRLFTSYYPTPAQAADVFQRRCSHCHGAWGGGDGPMAARQATRPRDYRRGTFKKTPLADKARPRHADLLKTLNEGIGGTAMPRFEGRFSYAQMAALADHVRYLAIRGETAYLTTVDYDPYDGFDPAALRENYDFVLDRWGAGEDSLVRLGSRPPAETPERVAHGRALFLDRNGAACVRCHGELGHGDGPASEVYNPETDRVEPFLDDWGNRIRPRDLVCSPYRFGSRPVDLFHRIHSGINGTPMPSHFGTVVTEADGTRHPLGEDDIWDLVFFVRSLRED